MSELSDDEILRIWSGQTVTDRPVMGRKKIIDFSRRILAEAQRSAEPVDEIIDQRLAAEMAQSDRWKRLYECAQNANAHRQDALDGGTEPMQALRLAQIALRRWQALYAEWQSSSPLMVRQMDWRLPPAEHVGALEAIDSALGDKRWSA